MRNKDEFDMDLLGKCLTGTASEDESRIVLDFIEKDKGNEAFYFRLKDIYEAASWNNLSREAETVKEWEQLSSKIKKSSKKMIFNNVIFKYAAILILGVFSTLLVSKFINSGQEKILTKVFTGKGERTQLILPDGTQVWLNACSSLAYSKEFGTHSRDITLIGEAYFKVKKNVRNPFIIDALGNKIQVLGTTFNVTAAPDEDYVSATLVEGSISFEDAFAHDINIIKPGQKISFNKINHNTTVEEVDTNLYTSWSKGEYRFENESFENIMKRLQRNYNVTFIIKNNKIRNVLFTGTFKNYESLDQILKVIKTNIKINYEIKNDTVFIK